MWWIMNNKEIEKSIIKTYRKEIWARFVKAVKEFKYSFAAFFAASNDSVSSSAIPSVKIFSTYLAYFS